MHKSLLATDHFVDKLIGDLSVGVPESDSHRQFYRELDEIVIRLDTYRYKGKIVTKQIVSADSQCVLNFKS